MRLSDESHWRRLSEALDLYSDWFRMRLETKEEAVGQRVPGIGKGNPAWESTSPQWYDDEIGMDVRAWNLLPYIDGLDQVKLNQLLSDGRSMIPSLSERIAARELTVGLMRDWGRFCALAGVLRSLDEHQSDVGHARSAEAGGKAVASEAHRRWFAHYFVRAYQRGQREIAEEKVERLIQDIIDNKLSVGQDYSTLWFHRFLYINNFKPSNIKFRKLRDAYKEHELSVKEMRRLVLKGTEGLPPVDLQFPDP